MKKNIFAAFISLFAFFAFCDEGFSINSLETLNVNYMLRGYCFAASRIVDKNAPGGFGGSGNTPKPVTPSMNIEEGKVYLLAMPDEEITFSGKYKGMKL